MNNLALAIDTTEVTDVGIIEYWNSISDVLSNYVIKTTTIDPVVGEKYRYSMTGLLTELNVPVKYHYPYILANGYTSSRDYMGDINIKMLDINKLDIYYALYKKRR